MAALQVSCSMIAAERQGRRIRRAYLEAVLRQEMGWHDQAHTAEVASRMSEDVIVRGGGWGGRPVACRGALALPPSGAPAGHAQRHGRPGGHGRAAGHGGRAGRGAGLLARARARGRRARVPPRNDALDRRRHAAAQGRRHDAERGLRARGRARHGGHLVHPHRQLLLRRGRRGAELLLLTLLLTAAHCSPPASRRRRWSGTRATCGLRSARGRRRPSPWARGSAASGSS